MTGEMSTPNNLLLVLAARRHAGPEGFGTPRATYSPGGGAAALGRAYDIPTALARVGASGNCLPWRCGRSHWHSW
jgi:hypothetical protein